MLSMAFLAEIIALRYDEIFANKQIYFLLARVSMAGNSFTTNLVIFRWLMITSMCLLLLDTIYSFLTIYKESKILHAFVSTDQISFVEVFLSWKQIYLKRLIFFLCPLIQLFSSPYLNVQLRFFWSLVAVFCFYVYVRVSIFFTLWT